MCQIQIIQKLGKDKIDKADMGEFFKMMCFGSIDNSDAFGIFNNSYIFKTKGGFDASKIDEYSLSNSNFIAGHNRLSTPWNNIGYCGYDDEEDDKFDLKIHSNKWNSSLGFLDNMSNIYLPTYGFYKMNLDYGKSTSVKSREDIHKDFGENINDHPFTLGDFQLMHNGVISNAQRLQNKYNFKTNIKTDSYIILELIDNFFTKSRIRNRIKRIANAIQKTCSEIEGSYSILLHDKKENKIFYSKNVLTSFSLYKYGDKILCGSTGRNNLKYLYFGMKRKSYIIKNKRIYMITSDVESPVVDITPVSSSSNNTWANLLEDTGDADIDIKIENFLKKSLGFIPYYKITLSGKLKISRNNVDGIREKINKIVKNPKTRLGWYIINSSDINPMIKKKKKVKVDKMKGGKK